MTSVWARSEAERSRLFDLVVKLFHPGRRLPENVSRGPVASKPFIDGDLILGGAGWAPLAALAETHGDSAVHLVVLDPGPESFGLDDNFAAVTFHTSENADSFYTGLYSMPPGQEVGYIAEVLVAIGDSGRWGVWVERDQAGVVLGEASGALGEWEFADGSLLMSAGEVLDGVTGMHLRHEQDPEFGTALLANYPQH